MTSTVILQLVQEGKLALDDPIGEVPARRARTARTSRSQQLAEMRSGLYSYTFDPAFNETLDKDPQKAWTPDELLKIAFTHPPNFAPGRSSTTATPTSCCSASSSSSSPGCRRREAFEQRIFEPLGLTHTALPAATDSSIPDPHPQGYQFGTNVETIDSYARAARPTCRRRSTGR